MFRRIHQGSHLVLELQFIGRFLNIDSVSLPSICSDFLLHHGSVLIGCMFLGTFLFLLGCSSVLLFFCSSVSSRLYDHSLLVHNYPYFSINVPFCFCGIVTSFSFLILLELIGFYCKLFHGILQGWALCSNLVGKRSSTHE